MFKLLSSLVFALSVIVIFSVLLFNRIFATFLQRFSKKEQFNAPGYSIFISMIIVVHNGEKLIKEKIENSLALAYPSDNFEIIVFSDGSDDNTEEIVKSFVSDNVRFLSSNEHIGKYNGLNNSLTAAKGEIIVFTDADAILESDALENLTKHFSNPLTGGVCGHRMISEDNNNLKEAQKGYIDFDSSIKIEESKIGSITSNDGKLFAIRKSLYQEIPPGVTDDMFTLLSVVSQKRRFIFEPDAIAYIRLPSRNSKHEIVRRRRIVSTSLKGIFFRKELLNPFKYGSFSLRLFANKVLRRVFPFALITLFISTFVLSFSSLLFEFLIWFQLFFYMTAILYSLIIRHIPNSCIFGRIASSIYFFCMANIGTFIGVIDFLRGKQVIKWAPVKSDNRQDN